MMITVAHRRDTNRTDPPADVAITITGECVAIKKAAYCLIITHDLIINNNVFQAGYTRE